jgi:hypothetical protein
MTYHSPQAIASKFFYSTLFPTMLPNSGNSAADFEKIAI